MTKKKKLKDWRQKVQKLKNATKFSLIIAFDDFKLRQESLLQILHNPKDKFWTKIIKYEKT
jgi:hypothetical protein